MARGCGLTWWKEQVRPVDFRSKHCLLVDLRQRTGHFSYPFNPTDQKNQQPTNGHLVMLIKSENCFSAKARGYIKIVTCKYLCSHPGPATDCCLQENICFLSLGFSVYRVGMIQVYSHRIDIRFYDTYVLVKKASVHSAQPRLEVRTSLTLTSTT